VEGMFELLPIKPFFSVDSVSFILFLYYNLFFSYKKMKKENHPQLFLCLSLAIAFPLCDLFICFNHLTFGKFWHF